MREGIKNFDWSKALPDVVDNYNSTYHRSIKATPIQVLEGKKENPIERKVVESIHEKRNESKNKNEEDTYFRKEMFRTFLKRFTKSLKRRDKMNTLKNLNSRTGNETHIH